MPPVDNILLIVTITAAAILFITEKLRVDLIALSVLVALLIFQQIGPEQALYGFLNTATTAVAILMLMIVLLLLKSLDNATIH